VVGYHSIYDVYNCKKGTLDFVDQVKPIMKEIVDTVQITVINSSFKQFEPIGVTGIYLLEESHLSIHTWPELDFAAIDIFSCSTLDAEKIKSTISTHFETSKIALHYLERGRI